jgi:hypothetical protein
MQLAVCSPAPAQAASVPRRSTPSSRPASQRRRPQAYIADVIARVADDWPASRWNELMPWNWRADTDQPVAQAA